jgi:hypothetical protein
MGACRAERESDRRCGFGAAAISMLIVVGLLFAATKVAVYAVHRDHLNCGSGEAGRRGSLRYIRYKPEAVRGLS